LAWAEVGQHLGLAYQIADDLCDVCGRSEVAGKPVGQDSPLGRPNAALLEGTANARARLHGLLEEARRRALALAADPGPIGALLTELHGYFLKTTK
jgi:geranylgeranyl pyrophosphate synthase